MQKTWTCLENTHAPIHYVTVHDLPATSFTCVCENEYVGVDLHAGAHACLRVRVCNRARERERDPHGEEDAVDARDAACLT